MLQALPGQEKYGKEMSDEQPPNQQSRLVVDDSCLFQQASSLLSP